MTQQGTCINASCALFTEFTEMTEAIGVRKTVLSWSAQAFAIGLLPTIQTETRIYKYSFRSFITCDDDWWAICVLKLFTILQLMAHSFLRVFSYYNYCVAKTMTHGHIAQTRLTNNKKIRLRINHLIPSDNIGPCLTL